MSIFRRLQLNFLRQSTAASVLLGRGAGSGAGDFQEITLGTGLSMSGTTLNASGGGGGTVLSPSQITASQNNYNPLSWSSSVSILRINSNNFHFITGLTATSDGHVCKINNVGLFPIGFDIENTNSSAANRFAQVFVILPEESIEIYYDNTSQRWRLTNQYTLNLRSPLVSQYYNEAWNIGNADNMATATLPNWTGTGSATVASALSYGGRSGVVELSTTTGSTNRMFYYVTNNTMLSGTTEATLNQFFEYNAVMRTPGNLSDGTDSYLLQIGFFDSVTGPPGDGVFFYYDHSTNSGNWVLRGINTSSSADVNSSIAVTTNAWIHFRIIVYPNQTARGFINGVDIGGSLTSANVPNVGRDMGLGAGIRKTVGSSARVVVLDRLGFEIIRKEI